MSFPMDGLSWRHQATDDGRDAKELGWVAKSSRRRKNPLHIGQRNPTLSTILPIVLFSSLLPVSSAQACISLKGSTTCPAFNQSSISTNPSLTGLFPFLSNVNSVQSFDTQLETYVSGAYVHQTYVNRFGCSSINAFNTSDLYARYTYSYLCNAIIQNSLSPCQISTNDAPPLCADSCGEFALSEQTIVSTPNLCGTVGPNAIPQLRSDFEQCAEPANSISGRCIFGYQNEPNNCGYQYNLEGLCSFCSASTINSTDSCCVTSQAESRCANVHLPTLSSMQPIFTTSSTSSASPASSTAASGADGGLTKHKNGLSGGQIAGIVVGSVIGALLLLGMLVCCCLFMRRKKQKRDMSSLNQPTPPLSGGSGTKRAPDPPFDAVPGARVTRMTALEGSSGTSPHNGVDGTRSGVNTSSNGLESTPEYSGAVGAIQKRDKSLPPPMDGSSPESGGNTSEEGAFNQSERMEAFKDYYSSNEIRPDDAVATLWAYQPRANDEFELERGDMIRIVGIWDDGWATGIRLNQNAEDWEPEHSAHRDSGVSGNRGEEESPPANGDVKAFPLVCVCLPQHWRKTIEGDAPDPTNAPE